MVLEEESLSWNHPFSNKKAVLISETRWRQCAYPGKLSTGTASSLLSKRVLMKTEAAVTAYTNIPNRFSSISRLGLCCSAPEAKVPAWTWIFGRVNHAWASLGGREEDARVLWGKTESSLGFPENNGGGRGGGRGQNEGMIFV